MNNKKGFTIVELLAVITIVAIVTLVAVPAVGGISKGIKSAMCKSKIKDAAIAAVEISNENTLLEKDGSPYVKIIDLIQEGYLVSDEKGKEVYKNPVDDSSLLEKEIYFEYNENTKKYYVSNMDDLYNLCAN